MPSGRRFGDALLDPSVIYVPLVAELRKRGIRPSYLSHITGHGMRKLMRAPGDWTYVIDDVPAVPEALSFLVEHAGIDEREAYGTFNMGAGFAVYVAGRARAGASSRPPPRAACAPRSRATSRRASAASSCPGLGFAYRGDELDLG